MSQMSIDDGMQWYAEDLAVCMQCYYEKENFVIELGIKNILSQEKWWKPTFYYVHWLFENVDSGEKSRKLCTERTFNLCPRNHWRGQGTVRSW